MLAAPMGALGVSDASDPNVVDEIVLIGGVNDDIVWVADVWFVKVLFVFSGN